MSLRKTNEIRATNVNSGRKSARAQKAKRKNTRAQSGGIKCDSGEKPTGELKM